MKNKLISTLIIAIMLISCIGTAFASEDRVITVFVDGEQIMFDVHPISENGRTLVPVRYIFEALGADVNWIQEESKAVAAKDDITIEIILNNNIMTRNGKEIALDVPAKAIDGRTLVPARAVAEALDAKVEWNQEEYKVIITSAEVLTADENTDSSETETKAEYAFTELSPSDTEKIKAMFDDIRYEFEQRYLYGTLIQSAEKLPSEINNNEENLLTYVSETWDYLMAVILLDIQIDSEDSYIFESEENFTEEYIITEYRKITEKLGMAASQVFDCKYAETPDKKDILLITFKTMDSVTPNTKTPVIKCKYIGIVPAGNTIRYFTLEDDPITQNTFFFCEILSDSRQNYGVADNSEEAFLKAVDINIK